MSKTQYSKSTEIGCEVKGNSNIKVEYITAKEAAKRMGVCYRTMLTAIYKGKYQQNVVNRRPLLIWDLETQTLREENKGVK